MPKFIAFTRNKTLYLLLLFSVQIPQITHAHESEKVKELERRIEKLEAMLMQQKSASGLKVKDMQDKHIDEFQGQLGQFGISKKSNSLTKEEQKKLLKEIENFKKAQEANRKVLEELEAEGY